MKNLKVILGAMVLLLLVSVVNCQADSVRSDNPGKVMGGNLGKSFQSVQDNLNTPVKEGNQLPDATGDGHFYQDGQTYTVQQPIGTWNYQQTNVFTKLKAVWDAFVKDGIPGVLRELSKPSEGDTPTLYGKGGDSKTVMGSELTGADPIGMLKPGEQVTLQYLGSDALGNQYYKITSGGPNQGKCIMANPGNNALK